MNIVKNIQSINMDEKDLKEMSQSELIALIMKMNERPIPVKRTERSFVKPIERPVPAPRTLKPVERPVPKPRTLRPVERPIAAPRVYRPKIVIVDDTKSIKPKKQKTVYNLDNLFSEDLFPEFSVDPFERTMIKANNKRIDIDEQLSDTHSRYQNLGSRVMNGTRKIRIYPKIDATLDDFRRSEVKLSKDKSRANHEFRKLFGTRLDKIQGERDTVSITLDVNIRTDSIDSPNKKDKKAFEKIPKRSIDKFTHDEYEVQLKKVIKQTLSEGDDGHVVVEKTYGPFTIEKPVNLSNQDTYKLAMYTLLNKNFTILSGQHIVGSGCKILNLKKTLIEKIKMGSLKLDIYFLCKQRPIKKHGKKTCVIDYVWSQIKGKRGFKTYTYDKLKDEIYRFVLEGEKISTDELVKWAKQCHPNVSVHGYDCRYKK